MLVPRCQGSYVEVEKPLPASKLELRRKKKKKEVLKLIVTFSNINTFILQP